MNPDLSCLGMIPQPYYQQYYLFQLLQQQQMFQYMMFQQQQATTTFPECKQEQGQVPEDQMVKNQIESTINTHQKQSNQLTDGDSGALARLETNDDDTQSRVNGHWTKQEHYMYLEFVRSHEIILKSKYDKKSKKIFKLMSQFIPTRTATQCRSHHQKFNPMLKGKKKNKQIVRQPPTVVIPQS